MDGFVLKQALMIYGSDKGGHYFQMHEVFYDNSEAKLREGRPLTKEALQELCRQVVPSIVSGIAFLDGRVLATAGTMDGPDVWWVSPAIRPVFFGGMIKLKSGPTPWPGLVLAAANRRLHIFAVRGDKRPAPETVLYAAPFFNMTGSSICLGNAAIPKMNNDYAVWERALFDSAFSEERNEKRITGGSLTGLWGRLVKGRSGKFPEDRLLPCEGPKTVGELIDSLKRSRNGYIGG